MPGPGPKKRPVLILSVMAHQVKELQFVTVQSAYGTSQNKGKANVKTQLLIENVHALNMARLFQATRFDLSKTRWIPWSERWFEPAPGSPTPVMGRLPDSYMQRLEVLRVLKDLSKGNGAT